MPLVQNNPRRPREGAEHLLGNDAGRRRSGTPDARGPSLQAIVLTLLLAVLGLTALWLPGTLSAARIAGEEQPVATTPAGSPPAAAAPSTAPAAPSRSPGSVRTRPVSPTVSAGTSGTAPTTAAAPSAVPAAASPRPASPAVSAGSAGMPSSPAPPAGRKPGEAPPVKTEAAPGAPTPPPPPAAQPAAAQPPATPPALPSQAGRYVTIDFDNVDITVFIKFVSELTGRNFVVDDKVKGKVTVISPKKISVDEVYKVFESVLEIYGFATVQAGEVIKVIPALDARGKNMDIRLKREEIAPEDKIVTQILTLQNASPDELKKVLDPLISKTSVILSYPPTGMLIITDVLSNVKRLQEIVTALDMDGVGEVISYVPLKYASATDMVKSLTVIFQQQAGKGALAPIKIVPDDRANALVILATQNDTAKVKELLKLMDVEMPRGAGAIRVYYLQNAKAEDLVKVLSGLPQQQARPAAAAATPAAAAASAAVLSKNVQVVADKSTNSLIITADTSDYLIIEDVIRKLDITRSMVYLEALVMEVNADKSFGLGVEWSALKDVGATNIGETDARNLGLVGFRGSSIIPQISSTGTIAMPSGFSIGVIGAGITIGGVLFPNIGAVLQAFQNDTDTRILATPQLLTLDNEDAEITVGSNVPYVTRQDTTVGSTTNYSNYEYKDVGVTLKVTPQINRDGFVRMKLDQSVTKVVSQSAQVDQVGNLVLTPTTLKRTAKTTVVVKSGETVVIGGMIQDDSSKGTSQVPLLGDIPLLGWLFKTKNTTTTKTNLFVFITPRIVQNPEDAHKIQEEKMDYIRALQEGTIRNAPAHRKENRAKE